MAKTLRDYLPDNVSGKVFESGDIKGYKSKYLVWGISDLPPAFARDFSLPTLSVYFLHSTHGQTVEIEPHLEDPIVSEETPERFQKQLSDNNALFAPDKKLVRRVRKLLEEKALIKNQ